ncbi:MAG: hypothetical protein JRH07_02255, partial [Deltaproteobacteria bacterium]|nr:hypothetical protein [Deltaproteobacteria bacterium]
KVFLLGSFSPGSGGSCEIEDPYGCSLDDLQRCYGEIERSLQGLYRALVSASAIGGKAPSR